MTDCLASGVDGHGIAKYATVIDEPHQRSVLDMICIRINARKPSAKNNHQDRRMPHLLFDSNEAAWKFPCPTRGVSQADIYAYSEKRDKGRTGTIDTIHVPIDPPQAHQSDLETQVPCNGTPPSIEPADPTDALVLRVKENIVNVQKDEEILQDNTNPGSPDPTLHGLESDELSLLDDESLGAPGRNFFENEDVSSDGEPGAGRLGGVDEQFRQELDLTEPRPEPQEAEGTVNTGENVLPDTGAAADL